MVDQENGKEIKEVLDIENNKVIWERAIPTYDTPVIPTRNAPLLKLTVGGKLVQNGTPTPDNPIYPSCNNGVLKYGVLGKNLCNPAFYTGDGWYVGTNNTIATAYANGTLVFQCKPNTTYSWWHTSGAGGCRAFELPTETVTQGQEASWAVGNPAYNDAMTVRKYTTSADAKLLCVLFARVVDQVGRTVDEQLADFMLVEGDIEAATAYEPYRGVGLYVDGTDEVISVGGKNLNGGTIDHKGYTSMGGESTSTTFAGTLWKIPCEAGQKFTVSWGDFTDGVSGVFINTWKTDGTWNMRQAISASTSLTYTIGTGIGTVNFTLYKTGGITIGDNAWIQVEYGDTATAYKPYITPQTASVDNLLSVGDYFDAQDIINGDKNLQIAALVLDGTENWNYGGNSSGEGFYLSVPEAKLGEKPISTHFQTGTIYGYGIADMSISRFSASSQSIIVRYDACLSGASVASFKAFLAAQYAAGTPVILWYVLATAVETQTAPQPLQGYRGMTLIVTAQSQYVSGQNIKVKYLGIDNLLSSVGNAVVGTAEVG